MNKDKTKQKCKFVKDLHGRCAKCKKDRWLNAANRCRECEQKQLDGGVL